MVEYICNRCGFGSDELSEGIDPLVVFEIHHEEYYCDGCMDEYNSGVWEFESEKARKIFHDILDKANDLEQEPTMAEVYDALNRLQRDPNDAQARWVLSRVTIQPRPTGKA